MQGAWLGENVCVIGASIGKNSVIGANSVVTKNIPDYCVAVGSPAKVIKKYNVEKQIWEAYND
jgi:acetyltransferase-like isoleucine patch superfamily enzyme